MHEIEIEREVPKLDVRFLRERVVAGRRPRENALNTRVFEHVKSQPGFEKAVTELFNLGVEHGVAAAYCTSGRHRSVAVVEATAQKLAQSGYICETRHETVNFKRKGRITVRAPSVTYKYTQESSEESGFKREKTDADVFVKLAAFLAELAGNHSELTHLPSDPKHCDVCADTKVAAHAGPQGHARDEADSTDKQYFVADLAGPFVPSQTGCRFLGVFLDVKRRLLYARGLRSKEDSDWTAFIDSARKELALCGRIQVCFRTL